MASVFWRITGRYDRSFTKPLTPRAQETLLPPWAESPSNALGAAEDIVQDYVSEHWDDLMGADPWCVLLLEITKPPEIAGRYRVVVERVPKATAVQLQPA